MLITIAGIYKVLVSLGIPTQIGQNRNQTVFAG